MDIILLFKALILGLVEGATEFLPISSTGHLIIVGDLLNFNDEKGKVFEIVIQLAAILAVCWEFRRKLIDTALHITSQSKAQQFVPRFGAVIFGPKSMIDSAIDHCRENFPQYSPAPIHEKSKEEIIQFISEQNISEELISRFLEAYGYHIESFQTVASVMESLADSCLEQIILEILNEMVVRLLITTQKEIAPNN